MHSLHKSLNTTNTYFIASRWTFQETNNQQKYFHVKILFTKTKGCKRGNMSHTQLLRGLFLEEYFKKYSLKNFQFFFNIKKKSFFMLLC
jgi:hypothetical protein